MRNQILFRKPRIIVGVLAAFCQFAWLSVTPSFAQTPINLLTDNATVRDNGTYTYYARGNSAIDGNITAFTQAFYPGHPHIVSGYNYDNRLWDTNTSSGSYAKETNPQGGAATATTHNGAPVSIAYGKLSDGKINSAADGGFGNNVSYWYGVTDVPEGTTGGTNKSVTGTFDVLFDLGAQYYVTGVEIVYGDGSSNRWATNTNQTIYTATSLADPNQAAESDFSIFGSAQITSQPGTSATLSITSTSEAVLARYVDLRLAMSVALNYAGNTAVSQGGYIQEVRIYGYEAIPEPSAYAVMAGVAALIACGIIRYFKSH